MSMQARMIEAAERHGLTAVMPAADIIRCYEELAMTGRTWLETSKQRRLFTTVILDVDKELLA